MAELSGERGSGVHTTTWQIASRTPGKESLEGKIRLHRPKQCQSSSKRLTGTDQSVRAIIQPFTALRASWRNEAVLNYAWGPNCIRWSPSSEALLRSWQQQQSEEAALLRTIYVPHILMGASSSKRIGCCMKMSLAFTHSILISPSSNCTCFPGRAPTQTHDKNIQINDSHECH